MAGYQKDLATLQWDDPLLLDDLLSDDERMIRDTARAYAQDKLQPRIIEAYRNETTDRAIFDEMGELGLLRRSPCRRITAARARPTSPTASSPARSSGSIPATAR